jgi:hypothetical protein
MSSNFSPEDIARFQTFLNQLSTSTSQPIQAASNEPSSSSMASNSLFGTSGLHILYIFKISTYVNFQDLHHLFRHLRPRLKQKFLLLPSSIIRIDKDITFINQDLSHSYQDFGTRLNLPPTSIANQARLASADNTLPRQVSLPIRGRCRAIVQQAPVLARFASKKITIDDCLVSDTSVRTIRIVARVFPPLVWISYFHLFFTNILPV